MTGSTTPDTPEEVTINQLRAAATLASGIVDDLLNTAHPGSTPNSLADLAHQMILAAGAEPILLGFPAPNVQPFPAAACVGINEQAVNALPSQAKIQPNDVVHVDVCLRLNGYCADVARSRTIEPEPGDDLPERVNAMCAVWFKEPWAGRRTSEIGARAEQLAEEFGIAILPEFLGHGIGLDLHQPPLIPGPFEAGLKACRDSFPDADPDPVLQAGQVLAAEIAAVRAVSGSRPQTRTLDDGWSRSVSSGAQAAIRERMLLVGSENNVCLDPEPRDFERLDPLTDDSGPGAV